MSETLANVDQLLNLYWADRTPASERQDDEDDAIQSWLAAYHDDWGFNEEVGLSALDYDGYDGYNPEEDCSESPCGCDPLVCDADEFESPHYVEVQVTGDTHNDGSWGYNASSSLTSSNFGYAVFLSMMSLSEEDDVTLSALGLRQINNAYFTFNNVLIPSGARIRKSRLKFVSVNDTYLDVDEQPWPLDVNIRAHCHPDSEINPTTALEIPYYPFPGSFLDWPRTATKKEWTSVEVWATDQIYYSPDISCVIQELINFEDWNSGQSIKLFIEESTPDVDTTLASDATRRPYDYSQDPTKATTLQVWYSYVHEESGQNGVVCGGSSEIDATYEATSDGGTVCRGVADVFISGLYDEIAEGGIEIGGSVTFTYDELADGGIDCGGTSDLLVTYEIILEGGAICGGVSEPLVNYEIISEGGSDCGGNSDLLATYEITSEGGAVCGGSGTFTYDEVTAGGALVSISSDVVHEILNLPSGGSTCNGSCDIEVTYNIEPIGGCAATGESSLGVITTRDAGGGAELGFTATMLVTRDINPTGGVVANISSERSAILSPPLTGGVTAEGHGAMIFDIDDNSGGALVHGYWIARNLIDYPEGGVQVNGGGKYSIDKFLIKVDDCGIDMKCGYSNDHQFCSTSDKIQGYGSKFGKALRKDVAALCMTPIEGEKTCYGSTAVLPAITFCQQRIRTKESDMPPKTILTSGLPKEMIRPNQQQEETSLMLLSKQGTHARVYKKPKYKGQTDAL